jgi:hypothetical protein
LKAFSNEDLCKDMRPFQGGWHLRPTTSSNDFSRQVWLDKTLLLKPLTRNRFQRVFTNSLSNLKKLRIKYRLSSCGANFLVSSRNGWK